MKKSALAILLLTSVCAWPAQAGWVSQLSLTQVGSGDYAGEYVWFSVSQGVVNPAGCANTDIYVLRTLPKNALAILLSAKVSGTPIRAFVHETLCDTATARPLVTEVGIQ